MKLSQILIVGASGFIGRALSLEAVARGLSVRAANRSCSAFSVAIECVAVGDIDGATNWLVALKDCDTVIHLAARAHIMIDTASDPLAEFRKVNVDGTLNLARQAAKAGVRRFVFISSIKVNGELTYGSQRFECDDIPAPRDAYGISKANAESGLWQLAQNTGMEVTIIRSPLVYGPGAKGNFSSLIGWLSCGVPLPLGAITQNRRSFVGLDNLVDLILTCVDHPNAANQIFLVSDGEDLSTTELLKRMGKVMNRPIRLLSVPASLLAFVASLLGKKSVAQRLLGSLQVDISKTCFLLDWKPPVSVDEGLRKAVEQRV